MRARPDASVTGQGVARTSILHAQTEAPGLAALPAVASVHAWDLRFERDLALHQAVPAPIVAANNCAALCERAAPIRSAVTATNIVAVAQQAAAGMTPPGPS